MALGLIGSAVAGGMVGVGESGKQLGNYLSQAAINEQQAEILAQRARTMAAITHEYGQSDIRLRNDLEQAPKRAIGEAVTRYTDERRAAMNPTQVDDSGLPQPQAEPSTREVSDYGAREAMRRGEVGMAKDFQTMGAPKVKSLNPGDVLIDEVTGKPIADNMAGLDAKSANDRRAAEFRQSQAKELEEFKAKLRKDYRLNPNQATAMERNINFMVENGLADDAAGAFEKLRTGMAKSPAVATEQMVSALIRSDTRGQYRGKDGRMKAIADARDLVGAIRGIDEQGENDDLWNQAHRDRTVANQPGGPLMGQPRGGASKSYTANGRTFTDADIDFTAAKNNLTREQVKQRLGIK